ncbi:hypothetical protein acsn021_18980 [Anaerocolumna cellulosilytica]|uniref:DUF5107 domain-containing protein n=1 Tax=Anaerocolumna cellulosilytica TaxID=433286 RepID=A0A6S6QZ36_9FIRM|nr:DUF5107 domain-containing protein [Anaerocolumna cellulosilytica]MBB5194709.1 tetratricopeptide (TPR) repeat protein [Anaerocolumna cellulosilytica]BCJ94329.1 hypothetical protein acsn021_18980 [Anaerocolumna cellulosilytica]
MENDSVVMVWEEEVVIPTYEIGKADKNPMFLDKRVYQGSSGKIYPYPMVETISDEKKDKIYKAVFLENKYIRVMILPELGGRIQRAYDKTNKYDFIYYNRVIKPALVGLTGPWISGGIEFNWPQHHRPTTFMPVDYVLQDNEDGSKTVFINDVDQMYGTKGIAGFTLYPDTAYIEIRGQLYNRTPLPQTFLWWANPAVAVNDYTQSIFPPDVHAVMDHGKRDVSRFPIATGVYYKKDYSAGVDISRYKNIPVPTSYMAEKSDYDFVGGYDHNLQAGLLHVADHHIAPGKKQWTWGCGDFGKAWDRNLTDEDGPYIELMTGVYTDNQPDFTWLKPFEEKSFYQYFMPYKKVGAVKNATIHGAVNMTVGEKEVSICVYTTKEYDNAVVTLYSNGKVCYETNVNLSPIQVFDKTIPCEYTKETDLKVVVSYKETILVEYQPQEKKIEKLPKPAEAAKEPSQIMTNEELYLTGLHIEQYRHATYHPEDYYLEGLKRDGGDIRINTAYGALLLRKGNLKKAEEHFRKAIKRLTWKNPNPYNSEPYYLLGLSLFYQGAEKESYDSFYKASWSNEQQEMSFYFLAVLETRQGNYNQALSFIDKALSKNTKNIKARGLRAALLRKLGKTEIVQTYILENLETDRFDSISLHERILTAHIEKKAAYEKEMNSILRGYYNNYLQAARDYAEAGLYEEAVQLLAYCKESTPLLYYYRGYYYGKLKQEEKKAENYQLAAKASPVYCFPNKLEDMIVLEEAVRSNPLDAKGFYYLGNLYYDKQQFEQAATVWEKSKELDKTFPTVYRNLALAYYNKLNKKEKAREAMETAFTLDTTDARIFLELDQLYKKLFMSPEERLETFKAYSELYKQRDDLYLEYVTLHNQVKQYAHAYELLKNRKFHPWEGGEGKVTSQYKLALIQLAKEKLRKIHYEEAKVYLNLALSYPENLGEGKLEGTKDNHIYYYLGVAEEALGNQAEAERYYEIAAAGDFEPAGMMYYNDQPADMILFQGLALKKLGRTAEANARFYKLLDYGEQHLFDKVKVEYFAVSLPDFLIFEEDLSKRSQVHCNYLIGLAYLGMGVVKKSREAFEKALALDRNHMESLIYLEDGLQGMK